MAVAFEKKRRSTPRSGFLCAMMLLQQSSLSSKRVTTTAMGRRDVSSRALLRKEDDDDDAYYYWDDDDVNDVNDEFYDAEAAERLLFSREEEEEEALRRRRRRRLAMRRRDDNRRASSSSSVSRGTTHGGERVAALIDGGEVFFISSAVAMKARQVYVEQRARGESSAASSASTNALMDVPLYVAVVVGAVLRRASNNVNGGVFSSSVFANGIRSMKHPTKGVNARVENLEVGFERLDENQARYSRDVSRLGTRVRLTRRELSPMIRRAEATSVKFGAVATELSRRVEVAEEEGRKLAETMASLHAVSAKQFEVLSKSVRELRAAIKELEMEAEEAAMMTIEEEEDGSVPSVSSRRSTTSNSRYAKKEEVEKLERMLTEALDEMEDCLTTMVREKAVALGQEIDDISLLEDHDDDDDDDEKKKKEEDEKELVWAGESSGSPQTTTSFARDDEETDAAEPPSIQLYKFEDFESTPTPTNDDTNADKNTSE